MGNLLREEYACTAIELSTIEKGFRQQISREFLSFESSFSAVRICVKRADGIFYVLVNICIIIGIIAFRGR